MEQHEAGMNGMQESFNEAIVQLVIIFSTGHISYAQMASISFSIFSLSWASWRVFFILRTRDESDPDPNFKTTFLQILPWELMIVINSTILWTLIGGLLGKYFFIRVLLGFFVLYVTEYTRKRNSSDTKAHEEDENVNIVNTVLRSPEKQCTHWQQSVHNEKCTHCKMHTLHSTLNTMQNPSLS